MYRTLICLSLIVVTASSAGAANTVTFYRDGALVQQEATAVKGVIELPLAADLLESTFTVVPVTGTTILGVESYKKEAGGIPDKELEALTEQRLRLEDRIQALEAREAIFTTAAKAQGGKAPRKTKANPDPMQAIRQGTDFAIAQLEAVYTARRKATQEIKKIDIRLAAARKGSSRPAESFARITVTPQRGTVTVRYATTERGWQAYYNLFLTGDDTARLQLSARITGSRNGFQSRVSSGTLAGYASAETVPALAAGTVLSNYRLPLSHQLFSEGIYPRFSGRITNNSPHYLPSGESGYFRNGSYQGRFRFDGLSSGRSAVISTGR